jgi:hypothetical protein
LLVYYTFEGNGADSSGYARDLWIAPGTGFGPGLVGQALSLDRDVSHYAVRPVSDPQLDFGLSDFSIQVWVNFDSTAGEHVVLEKFYGCCGPGWTLLKKGGNGWRFAWGVEGLNIDSPVFEDSTHVWHAVVVRRRAATLDLFYDNTMVASGSMPAVLATDMPLLVGKRNAFENRNAATDGRIDEVAIWRRALTDSEISALWNNGNGRSLTLATPPASLELKTVWRPAQSNAVQVVQASGPRVLAGTDNWLTHLIDATDPVNPSLSATWESLVTPSALVLRDNIAFIAGWEPDFVSTVEAVDFTDPGRPALRDFFDTPGYVHGIAITDRHAFVADGDTGLIILDITDPANLRQVGSYETRSPLWHIDVSGNLACLGLEGGLILLDVTDPANPTRVGVWPTSGSVRDLQMQGSTVYFIEEGQGLRILDVRQPAIPVLVGTQPWVAGAVALDVAAGFAFLASGTRGLEIIDVSNPANPEWMAGYTTSGPALDVAASGNRVWVAAGTQGLLGFEFLDRRINVTQPGGPEVALTYSWQAGAGWRLERATRLEDPDWQPMLGSDRTNRVTLPLWGGNEFFRLVKP